MAMIIFFVLNGAGLVFLLYVLANFWKEGHGAKNDNAKKYVTEFGREEWTDVYVVTHPISHAAQGGISVIPFPMQVRELRESASHCEATRGTREAPARRFSTR